MNEQWQIALKWLLRGLIFSVFTFFLPYIYIVPILMILYAVLKFPEKSKLKTIVSIVLLLMLLEQLRPEKWYTHDVIFANRLSWITPVLPYLLLLFIVYLLKPLSEKTDSMREYKKMEHFCTVVVVTSLIAFSFGMNVTENSQLLIIVGAGLFYIAALITVIHFLRFMLRTGVLFLKN
ncbi:hypothetical protein [Metasolibacillus sp. FSL K6-0083]|uniref:hypothetical protein n=1 Tax=Metasolibacillus sp. FSL K6-0083 TaxID=2921416 RepID=UPI003159F2A7